MDLMKQEQRLRSEKMALGETLKKFKRRADETRRSFYDTQINVSRIMSYFMSQT